MTEEIETFKFILEDNAEIELEIHKQGNYFGIVPSSIPEGFIVYNTGVSFGSVGALMCCETRAQSHTSASSKPKKVALTTKQNQMIWEYLNSFPDTYYSHEYDYNYTTKQYDVVIVEQQYDKSFPPKNIELVLR